MRLNGNSQSSYGYRGITYKGVVVPVIVFCTRCSAFESFLVSTASPHFMCIHEDVASTDFVLTLEGVWRHTVCNSRRKANNGN